jgi:Domain of unknown function (DUF4145)
MRRHQQTRLESVHFQCPNAACRSVQDWPSCQLKRSDEFVNVFPLTICTHCGLFIEVDAKVRHDSVIGCIREHVSIRFRAFKEYVALVPAPVRAALHEALKCHDVQAWNASVAMTRKAVEAMATDLSADGRTLFNKLHDLRARKLVSAESFELEDTIRNYGNLAVHYDSTVAELGDEEADCALAYAYEVSKQIYLRPQLEQLTSPLARRRLEDALDNVKWRRRYRYVPVPKEGV